MQKPIKIVVFIALLLSASAAYAQQYNTDNYLTMPHGTGTFVLTTGQRNETMYSTFTLLPQGGLVVIKNEFVTLFVERPTPAPMAYV